MTEARTPLQPRATGDLSVSPVGLGGCAWSLNDAPGWPYDSSERSTEEAVEAIHSALDAGLTLLDTARAYTTRTHPGHSEELFRLALASYPGDRGDIVVATKGGHFRDGDSFPIDARPEALRRDCEASLQLLGVEVIDLYQLHWPDPEVPLEESVGALAELREAGLIRHIGVSNVSLPQLETALATAPIASVQNHFSPFDQEDRETIELCAERGLAYLVYSPLRGRDTAGRSPQEAFPGAAAVAERRRISMQRLTLAWMLTLSPTIVPITGASRPATIRDSAAAAETTLTDDDLAALDFDAAA